MVSRSPSKPRRVPALCPGKRTDKTSTHVMVENAFVMLNLHNWDTPTELLVNWVAEKITKKWREVHFIDGYGATEVA
ncbi:hypothetical protein CBM2586_A50470 [Cupriavidus phytorum]|uniref:Uncharacterized protein n=1 Tax=Cupriavidus taiwanensis TaxID=164546 RepID=A0A375C456_9BURK|nr:hypothetical protein CBM2586_A50470 [Cupriavidus taiwanensis]